MDSCPPNLGNFRIFRQQHTLPVKTIVTRGVTLDFASRQMQCFDTSHTPMDKSKDASRFPPFQHTVFQHISTKRLQQQTLNCRWFQPPGDSISTAAFTKKKPACNSFEIRRTIMYNLPTIYIYINQYSHHGCAVLANWCPTMSHPASPGLRGQVSLVAFGTSFWDSVSTVSLWLSASAAST